MSSADDRYASLPIPARIRLGARAAEFDTTPSSREDWQRAVGAGLEPD